MIPKLYQKDGTTLIGTLTNCIECLVEEERNGLFEVTLQYPNEAIATSLVYDNIIICDANDTLKNQKFRIYDTRRMMNNIIEVYARHISFDLAYDYISSIDITNQSCEYALNTIFRNSQFSTGYKGHSDIVNAQNYKISNCNVLEAIAGKQGSIIDTYGTGAEILRDNTDIHVLNARGHDNSVSIEYAKNLTGFELQENTDDLITRIIPFATYTPEGGEQTRVQATAVDSQYINDYSHPFISELDFSDKFEENEEPTTAKLATMAQQYFIDNKCDLPKQNWKIEFIPLSKCVGYESIEDAISLCDTVTIKDTRYNIDTKAKVIKTVYDVLRDRYDSMELGEPRTTLGDIVNTGSEKGEQGPPGPQGPKGEDGNIGDFPDSLPSAPVLSTTLLGFASIQLDWTYDNKPYYWYEVYASKTKGFTPNTFDLIHKGQTSSFLFQAKPGETWYFRVCAVNSYGNRTAFSDQKEVITTKVDDLSNYFTTAAIGHAVVGSLTADYMTTFILKGNWIDAKNLSVTDGNGKRTLDIDSYGNVNLDVTSLRINNKNVIDGEEVNSLINQTADEIKTNVTKLQGMGQKNLLFNTDYTQDYKYWNYGSSYTWIDSSYLTPNGNTSMTLDVSSQTSNMYIGASQILQTKLVPGQQYSLSFYYLLYEALPPDYGFGVEVKGNNGSGTEESITIYSETENYTFGVWRRAEITFTMTNHTSPFVYIYLKRNGRITFGDFKLVRGASTGSWDPAPEDSKDYAESKISQTAENIRTEVSQIYSTKSELSVVDQKANSISASVASKVGNDEIISKINMSPESISIQANKIDMTGAMDLHGTFTCYANESNHEGNKLVQAAAIHRGYLAGWQYPVFSSGIWNPSGVQGEDMGYVSVGWGNSDHVDQYGCLYMSPIVLGGGQIVYSKLDDSSNPVKSGINFKLDGSVEYMSFHPEKTTVGATSHSFDGGLDCLTLKARDAIISGSININSSLYTDTDSLYLIAGGYGNQYYLSLQKTGYLIPFGSGGIQLGDAVQPFTTLYCTNAPVVMSDKEKKTDIKYLDDNVSVASYSLKSTSKVTDSDSITKDDMYNFVKDDLKLASYKLKDSNKDKKDKIELGFIAQDIKDTKVGKYIVEDDGKNNLMYDMGNRISVLEGALQKAIEKIEMLENIINPKEGE